MITPPQNKPITQAPDQKNQKGPKTNAGTQNPSRKKTIFSGMSEIGLALLSAI
jgi:hypothetical protein